MNQLKAICHRLFHNGTRDRGLGGKKPAVLNLYFCMEAAK